MTKPLQVLFVFLLVVVSFHFFDARFLNKSFTNYTVFYYSLVAIIISIPHVFIKRIGFVLPVQLICLSMLVSVVMAKIFWGQSLMDSIIVTVPLMLWIFFFYLLRIQISIKIVEEIILVYGVIYILLYFYQITHSQTAFFGERDILTEDRGVVRIILGGGGIFFLSSFMALNKFTTQKPGRWFWISLSILGILIPILTATKQLIGGVLIIYLFHFIKDQSFFRKLVIIASFIGMLLYVSHSDNELVKGIIESQENSFKEGKDYIRIRSGVYFLTEFSPNNINMVLGNGVPYEGISDYGKFVGIISVYIMFGILAIIAYILIWINSFTFSLPNEYYYLKYYLWFLLITSLTSYNVYSYNYLVSTVFVLYIYQTIYIEQIGMNVRQF